MENKIKILGIGDNSGSRYHRVSYPLSKIHGEILEDKIINVTIKESKDVAIDYIKQFDILMYDWDMNLSTEEIENLKSSSVKTIYSLGDFWEFCSGNPTYLHNKYLETNVKDRVIQNLRNATAVIVPTERLLLHVKKYNNNIAISPNFLDPNDFKIEKTESDKLRIGLVHSLSHYGDLKSLKGAINRIGKNRELAEKCEFYICGVVRNNPYWEDIIRMFTVKKHLKLHILEALPIDKYFNFYKNLDVCLLPLEENEFNYCRSALKLNECAITNTIPIGSPIYSTKELKGIVVAETPLQYEQTLVKLLDKDFRKQILDYVTKVNLEDSNYTKRFENLKLVIGAVYSEDLSPSLKAEV